MSKSAPGTAQGGFTLIELVVVIVILGILAAFAVPRFAALDGQARVASVRSMEGAIRSAAMLAHSEWLAAGTSPATVRMDGVNVAMVRGYPNAALAGIGASLQEGSLAPGNATTPAGRYRVVGVNGNTVDLRLNGAPNTANCRVRYVRPAVLGDSPIITIATSGC